MKQQHRAEINLKTMKIYRASQNIRIAIGTGFPSGI